MGDVVRMDKYRRYTPVMACCDHCDFAKVIHVTDSQYKEFKKGGMLICPECKCATLYYCDKAR